MAITRLLHTSKPSCHATSSSSSTTTTSSSSFSSAKTVRCGSGSNSVFNNNGDRKRVCGGGGGGGGGDLRKSAVPIKASAVATSDGLMIDTNSKPEVYRGIMDPASLVASVTDALLKVLSTAVERRALSFQIQRFIEKAIIDCRFFTFFAVGGSLLGSILCFVEGCLLLLESYFKFFNTLSQKADQAHIMHLVIEAIDMFLVGTALLAFGVGLYAMFVGSKNIKENSPKLTGSSLFGFFYLKTLPKWVAMESISQAKSRIGHAVMMILQVGVLEKFNSIPVATCLDLVCFAGAVLLSSASIFLLSRLSVDGSTSQDR